MSETGVLQKKPLLARQRKQVSKLTETDLLSLQAVNNSNYGFVLCTPEGLILKANKAFLKLTKIQNEKCILGHPVNKYLGLESDEISQMLKTLKGKSGSKSIMSSIETEDHAIKLVNISAVSIAKPKTCIGLFFRVLDANKSGPKDVNRKLVRTSAELSMLVSHVPLKDIVSETTDLIEQLCIKEALNLTKDNRVSAADILGLSRQSLYIKLRKYNLLDQNIDLH
jgi:transcriptional regulator with PAS, ATPase and Fis domain